MVSLLVIASLRGAQVAKMKNMITGTARNVLNAPFVTTMVDMLTNRARDRIRSMITNAESIEQFFNDVAGLAAKACQRMGKHIIETAQSVINATSENWAVAGGGALLCQAIEESDSNQIRDISVAALPIAFDLIINKLEIEMIYPLIGQLTSLVQVRALLTATLPSPSSNKARAESCLAVS